MEKAVTPTAVPEADVAKRRKCLRCSATFLSAWSGQRVCGHCKSTKSWRDHEPLRRKATTEKSASVKMLSQ